MQASVKNLKKRSRKNLAFRTKLICPLLARQQKEAGVLQYYYYSELVVLDGRSRALG
jgi:hypothetical protein